MKIHIIEKSKKINSGKNSKSISYKTKQQNFKNDSKQNSMTEMCRALFKYENERKIG